jgi:3-methyl-2-oxobutanoate hydroxymethyltransferase
VSIEPLYGGKQSRRITTSDLIDAKSRGEKWPMITSYDALSASIFDEAGIPVLLVGDSAAMVVYGYDSTIPVTVSDLLPLVAAVERGSTRAMVLADLPFGSYQASPAQALETAVAFMQEGRAHAVKIEGGRHMAPQVELLTSSGIPVMGHIGLTPQSVHQMGGYKVQGRGDAGEQLIADAHALVAAGVFGIVLEVVPHELASRLTSQIPVPVIGIGAGPGTDAQVIVWQDLLGLTPGKQAKFVKSYANLREEMLSGARAWASDVTNGTYPDLDHSYS